MTKVITVNNQKGGVAKTTTSLSLGACLAEMGHSVLLIDFDPQAHLTISLGIKLNGPHRTVSDALLNSTSLVSVSRESSVPGLDIVPANQQLSLIDKVLYSQAEYEFRLKKRLGAMQESYYDFVIIDCPPSFSALTLNALTAADLLVIPVQCEYYAVRSLPQIVKLARTVQQRTNPQLNYRMVVTMFDRRNRICHLMYDQMQQQLGGMMCNTIIEIDTKLRESPAFGKPITQYAPHTRGAEQYREFAKEITRNGQPQRRT